MSKINDINQNSSKTNESSNSTHYLPESQLNFTSVMKNRITFDKRTNKTDMCIYSLIEQMESNTGLVYYSNRAIAEILDITIRNVQKSKAKLISFGYLLFEDKEIILNGKKIIKSCWIIPRNNVFFDDDPKLELVKNKTKSVAPRHAPPVAEDHPPHVAEDHPPHVAPRHPISNDTILFPSILSLTTTTENRSSAFSKEERIEELADLQISKHGLIDDTQENLKKEMLKFMDERVKSGRANSYEHACAILAKIIDKEGGFRFDKIEDKKVVIQKTCEEIALEIEKENERRKEYNRKVNEFKSNPENVNVVESEFQQMRKALGMRK